MNEFIKNILRVTLATAASVLEVDESHKLVKIQILYLS
jgi:hypothetical protein